MKTLLGMFIAGLAAFVAFAQQAPSRDPVFERWVRDTFFEGYTPASSSQRWDIPAAANPDRGGIPVNPKAAKYGAAVELGDALRQYEIDQPFMLIVGFWQAEEDSKRFVNLIASTITPEQWRKLWGPVTYADLQKFDALIRDTGPSVEETRRLALRMKHSPPFNQAVIQLIPRIDSSGPRRLQCSVRFDDVFQYLAPGADPKPQARPTLFGVEYPGAIAPQPGVASAP